MSALTKLEHLDLKSKMILSAIRANVRAFCKDKHCVMLGVIGRNENIRIEIDHNDDTKRDRRISNLKTQTLDNFQFLCKTANDAKRQICKKCQETDLRFDARIIKATQSLIMKAEKFIRIRLQGLLSILSLKI